MTRFGRPGPRVSVNLPVKWNNPMQIVASAVLAATLIATGAIATPAAAVDIGVQFRVNRIRNATPTCRANPDAPFVGRVSGFMGLPANRSVGFEGCFDTAADCQFWRGRVSGAFDGRIIYNQCETR